MSLNDNNLNSSINLAEVVDNDNGEKTESFTQDLIKENESEKSFESCLNKEDDSEKSFASCSQNDINKEEKEHFEVQNPIEKDKNDVEESDDDDIRPGACRDNASTEDEEGSSWDEKKDDWAYDPEFILHSKDEKIILKASISKENMQNCEEDLKQILENHVKCKKEENLDEANVDIENELNLEKNIKKDDRKEKINDRKSKMSDPSVIPTSGKFFMHDLREGNDEKTLESQNKGKQKKKDEGKWKHDLFNPDKEGLVYPSNTFISNRSGKKNWNKGYQKQAHDSYYYNKCYDYNNVYYSQNGTCDRNQYYNDDGSMGNPKHDPNVYNTQSSHYRRNEGNISGKFKKNERFDDFPNKIDVENRKNLQKGTNSQSKSETNNDIPKSDNNKNLQEIDANDSEIYFQKTNKNMQEKNLHETRMPEKKELKNNKIISNSVTRIESNGVVDSVKENQNFEQRDYNKKIFECNERNKERYNNNNLRYERNYYGYEEQSEYYDSRKNYQEHERNTYEYESRGRFSENNRKISENNKYIDDYSRNERHNDKDYMRRKDYYYYSNDQRNNPRIGNYNPREQDFRNENQASFDRSDYGKSTKQRKDFTHDRQNDRKMDDGVERKSMTLRDDYKEGDRRTCENEKREIIGGNGRRYDKIISNNDSRKERKIVDSVKDNQNIEQKDYNKNFHRNNERIENYNSQEQEFRNESQTFYDRNNYEKSNRQRKDFPYDRQNDRKMNDGVERKNMFLKDSYREDDRRTWENEKSGRGYREQEEMSSIKVTVKRDNLGSEDVRQVAEFNNEKQRRKNDRFQQDITEEIIVEERPKQWRREEDRRRKRSPYNNNNNPPPPRFAAKMTVPKRYSEVNASALLHRNIEQHHMDVRHDFVPSSSRLNQFSPPFVPSGLLGQSSGKISQEKL